MIDLDRIAQHQLESEPYHWAVIDRLFSAAAAGALADTFPHDRFKRHSYYGGDKDSEYEVRALARIIQEEVMREQERGIYWLACV